MGNSTSAVYSATAPEESVALRTGPPAAVRSALLRARERTLRLADDFRAALGPGTQVPYRTELNPPLWELGHIGWFQEWWIARNPQRELGTAADPLAVREPSLMPLADAWYDSSAVAHRSRWELPLPQAQATSAYLEETLAQTLQLLDALPADAGDDALYFFRLAALHEEMHAEAAVYMAQGIGIPVHEGGRPLTASDRELQVPATRFELGASAGGFAFDNELGAHVVQVPPFAIDAEPVTWAAYLPFVEQGGYGDARWWTADGRAWLEGLQDRHPAALRRSGTGWERKRDGRWQRLHEDEVALHLNAYEAEAWCRWAGRRLPTEVEWECAAVTQEGFRWGHAWEWTASPFAPYPGFVAHPYRDYSQPWFATRRVLRGASPATAPALAHPRYRNFFEPQRRDIFAGFRSVRMPDGFRASGV
jgi:gamma-glutamyl hercynylcysteine S-oxide synthase